MKKTTDKLNIERFDSADDATEEAGKAINKILTDSLKDEVLLLLSGGSAFKVLDYIDEALLSEHLTIAMVDERFSADPKINNFAQLQDTDFYIKALERDVNFFGTLPRKDDTKETLAQRLEDNLKNWREENPEGKILAVLGMGPDGHTAGIMPFAENPPLFNQTFENDHWIAAYDATGKNQYPLRVTSTLTFLKKIDKAIAYITGREKKPALDKIASKQATIEQMPAMVFWDLADLQIYTDIK